MRACRADEQRGVRIELSLDLPEILLVIGLVIPGLMYIFLGRKILRKDWLAMEVWFMAIPAYFILFYFLGQAGYIHYFYSELDIIWLIALILVGIIPIYFLGLGDILVYHVGRDVVMQAIQRILENRGLSYRLEVDTFTIPDIKMEIEVDHIEISDLVSIRTKSKDKDWTDIIQEDILDMFKGRPSERSHPALLI